MATGSPFLCQTPGAGCGETNRGNEGQKFAHENFLLDELLSGVPLQAQRVTDHCFGFSRSIPQVAPIPRIKQIFQLGYALIRIEIRRIAGSSCKH